MHNPTLTVEDVLKLPSLRDTGYESLNPDPDLTRPVRWAHSLESRQPAPLLQGDDFVLSTLTSFPEDLPDIESELKQYLAEITRAGASCLAVEVLPDRRRLRQALFDIARHLNTTQHREHIDGRLAILIFSRTIRFISITETVHRHLLLSKAEPKPPKHDPIFDATTRFFFGQHREQDIDSRILQKEASLLGLPPASAYLSFTCYFPPQDAPQLNADLEVAKRDLGKAIRNNTMVSRLQILVGEWKENSVAGIVGGTNTRSLHAALERLIRAVKSHTSVPAQQPPLPHFVVAVGHIQNDLSSAITELDTAVEVTRTATQLARHHPRRNTVQPKVWHPHDIGIEGLIARFSHTEAARSYSAWSLQPLRRGDYTMLIELIEAMVLIRDSKSELASYLKISRPTLYQRIRRLESLLGREVDGNTLVSLYAAIIIEKQQ